MLKSSAPSAIRLRGVRHNNLKNFDLDLPLHKLIVVTGLSGSGKSSLAFDTLFAEGQRRYIETFSPYARQFLDRMDKPQVDSIEGIPPAIAIEQQNSVRTTRSTVGTMTEICDYIKVLWPELAQLHCRQCGQPVRQEPPQAIWEALASSQGSSSPDRLLTFDLPLSGKLPAEESLALVAKQGYQRLLVFGQVLRVDDVLANIREHTRGLQYLTVIQDRLRLSAENRARFVEACDQAYHFGKGKLTVWESASALKAANPRFFSNRLHCATCDIEYREPGSVLFSFNHPVGACPKCRGFGRVISIDYGLAVPDRSRTLRQGVVKPWLTGTGLECQADLLRMCRHYEIPIDVPFEKLAVKWQELVIAGDPEYGKDEEHEWPRAWYGVKGYFRWLESRAYKMHVRVLLSRYRAYTTCPDCEGTRFQPDALLYRLSSSGKTPELSPQWEGLRLPDFYRLPVRDAAGFVEELARAQRHKRNEAFALALNEVHARLAYLNDVGLGYLSLDRPTRSLSGGETERVNLTTCLGTRLVNTLFVLDEPSVGLHPRDTIRLVRILEQLRNAGNTVVVVEHEASVMRAADQIIDLGPGHGSTGGQVVFQGSYDGILKCSGSLTGQYLAGKKRFEGSRRRPVDSSAGAQARGRTFELDAGLPPAITDDVSHQLRETPTPFGRSPVPPGFLRLSRATRHNLRNLETQIPLERLVCVTGVSGSGKTTLVREVLLPALQAKLKPGPASSVKASERIDREPNGEEREQSDSLESTACLEGWEQVDNVVLVDQSLLGKTPRSNPAVFIGAFDDIRELFAQSEPAKRRGLNGSAFSFNSSQGQCQRCRGAGFEKIEMQFLSDVFIRCPDCDGRRYRDHILSLKITAGTAPSPLGATPPAKTTNPARKGLRALPSGAGDSSVSWSIADVLDATVEEAIEFLSGFPESRPARRASTGLRLLGEVGLGYLRLGQPINTLSGGESQRLKLVKPLAVFAMGDSSESRLSGRTLFLFDEPTTGLHFDDVRRLVRVFQRLVDSGQSVLVIEHNLDLIRSADWIIDLGPGAGDEGGRVVAEGTPEEIMASSQSHTGRALCEPRYNRQKARNFRA